MPSVRANPNQNPMYIEVPDTGSTLQTFKRTIAQPADGSSFDVILPTPMASANYGVQATLAKASLFVQVAVDPASQTTSQFTCTTSNDLADGDSIIFTVEALS